MTLIFSLVRFIDQLFFRIPFSSASHAHPSQEEIRSTEGNYSGINTITRVAKPFKSRESHYFCRDLQSYNSPGDWARELFKHSTDSARLLVEIEKQTLFRFGFRVFWRWRNNEGMFWNFGHVWSALDPNPLTHSLDSKFCWKLRQNPRL